MKVRFEVPGNPVGKKRPQFAGGHAYTPQKTVEYENWVRLCYTEQCRGVNFEDRPLSMSVIAIFEIPKSSKKRDVPLMESGGIKYVKAPDGDNILKSVADGISGIAFRDDRQIYRMVIEKRYGKEPKAIVALWDEDDDL